ncbi:dynein regulatory complex subunit 4-like [Nicotiana sylvestris]|uniref:dynein regulatory complex subunit 4-like n=1 Tax=Nicotiana sylvestris TaxID=4096 RepID=UPI00388CA11E
MSYVNNEPKPKRPAKRPHVQVFDDKIQERLAWGKKEKEYKAVIHGLREELRNVTLNNDLQKQEAEDEMRRLVRENEALRAQVRQLKIEAENPGRSRKDERLIYNLTQKVRDYEDDLQKAKFELAKARARLAKSFEGRTTFVQQKKERYERGVTGWEKAISNLEGEMAKQAKRFKAEREHCYALMAWLERDLQQLQEQNQVTERTLEARTEQIGRLLQEKGVIREQVKRVANYIAIKCSSCEDMTRSMFFATVMIFVCRVMEDLYHLQDDLASRPATWPNDAPRVPGTVEALMYL